MGRAGLASVSFWARLAGAAHTLSRRRRPLTAGETLWTIAQAASGAGSCDLQILSANADRILDGDLNHVGQELRTPAAAPGCRSA